MVLLKCKYISRYSAPYSRSPALPLLMPRKSAYRRKIHAYARSAAWHARSRTFRTSVGFKCAGCGRVSRSNHAHHLSYRNAFGGREPDSDLMCLCSDCHAAAHTYARAHPGLTLRAATLKSLKVRKPGLLSRLFS